MFLWSDLLTNSQGYRLPAAGFPGAPEESPGAAAALLCPGAGHHFLDHLPGLPSHPLLPMVSEIPAGQDRSTFTLSPEPGWGEQREEGQQEHWGGRRVQKLLPCTQCTGARVSPSGSILGGFVQGQIGPHWSTLGGSAQWPGRVPLDLCWGCCSARVMLLGSRPCCGGWLQQPTPLAPRQASRGRKGIVMPM